MVALRKVKSNLLMLVLVTAVACPATASELPGMLAGLPENFYRSFTGYRLGLQIGAVATTALLSQTGGDASVNRLFQSGKADTWASPAPYAGYILPPLLGGGLYLSARIQSDDRNLQASFAAIQSTLMTLSLVSLLKFISGRPSPSRYFSDEIDKGSREFNFGFGKEGIYFGWPSGHTAVTSALLSSVASFYDNIMLWSLAIIGTGYMGFGMSAAWGGHPHWFSDTLAGALIGYSIGSSAGEGFRSRARGESETTKILLTPLPIFGGAGIQISAKID